jgi:hypothetical protein
MRMLRRAIILSIGAYFGFNLPFWLGWIVPY